MARPHAAGRRSLVDHLPGIEELLGAVRPGSGARGHGNIRGLTIYGIILLQEMMRLGLIIDVDHMSQKSADTALDMAEAHEYPVISSHCWFRDLTFKADVEFGEIHADEYGTADVHKVAHEAAKSAEHIERIRRLGGVVAPILNQGDVPDLSAMPSELGYKVPRPCPGSSTSWAKSYLYASAKMGGRGIAMGSDINGAAALPGPRFGTFAGYGARGDHRREALRRGQIDQQVNGVRYAQPIRDYRWHRFDESGPGAYDQQEREAWQGIAQYAAGFNPFTHHHGKEDFPLLSWTTVDNAAHMLFRQDNIDNITKGFLAAEDEESLEQVVEKCGPIRRWPDEQRAAYLVCRGLEPGADEHAHIHEWVTKIRGVWQKWQAMSGDNPPLERCHAGPRRDFDINLDGMAHYGMLPDFLQDMRNQGLAIEDFAPLFRSAEDYVQVWEKCQSRSAAINAANPAVNEDTDSR
jgi:hypothetical protein